jgi:fucose permease
MSNLHGMFSLGAMVGAAVASAMLHAGIAPALQLGGAAAILATVMLLASFGMLEVHASASGGEEKAHFAWPRGLLLMIGLLIFTGMIAEGVMVDWCVLYLKQELGMPQAQAALGYSAFAGSMAAARFGGDFLRARYSERTILFVSATVAAVSMAVVLIVAVPWVAIVGFVLVGAGVAPVAPILFNAATRVPGVSRAAAIASVTSVGYSGFMVGPPLIGAIAQATSLTVALSAVVVGALCLAIGSRKVPTA